MVGWRKRKKNLIFRIISAHRSSFGSEPNQTKPTLMRLLFSMRSNRKNGTIYIYISLASAAIKMIFSSSRVVELIIWIRVCVCMLCVRPTKLSTPDTISNCFSTRNIWMCPAASLYVSVFAVLFALASKNIVQQLKHHQNKSRICVLGRRNTKRMQASGKVKSWILLGDVTVPNMHMLKRYRD